MKKHIYICIIFLILFMNVSAKDVILTFHVINSNSTIDSIKAIKILSGKTVLVKGSNTLNLNSFTTGVGLTHKDSGECKVFPNPFNNQAQLELYSDNSDNISVYLINTSGQIVAKKSQMVVKGINRFTISINGTGMYTLSLIGNHHKYSKEIISLKANKLPNRIEYQGSVSRQLKKASFYPQEKEVIHFFIYSGRNITKIADAPAESKTYDVEFFECKDADGKNYPIVKIGTQWWMAENLAYLPSVIPSSTVNYYKPYYWVYAYEGKDISEAKSTENYKKYGVLYNWLAAKISSPVGWHLPSDAEWKTLEMYMGMSESSADNLLSERGTDEGTKLKATTGWNYNGNGTDEYGFSGLPGGYRSWDRTVFQIGYSGCWWSNTASEFSGFIMYRELSSNSPTVIRYYNLDSHGYSVRCIKD